MQETFSKLEIFREVKGAEDFLSTVSILGRKTLGSLETGKVIPVPHAQYEEDEDDGIRFRDVFPLSKRLVKTIPEKDLRVTLLDRRMPTSMNPNFSQVSKQLFSAYPKVFNPLINDDEMDDDSDLSSLPLPLAFDQIGFKYDVLDQESVELEASSLQLLPDIDYQDELLLCLGLNPIAKSTRMLVQQTNECITRLFRIPKGKRLVYPYSPSPLNIPIATLPANADHEKYTEFISEVDKLLPVKLIMGGIRTQIEN